MSCVDSSSGKALQRVAPWLLLAALLVPPSFIELVLAVAPARASYACYAAVAVLALVWASPLPPKRRLGEMAVLIAALSVLHWTPWNSRKVFLAAFERLEVGMSPEQVHELLAPVSLALGNSADTIEWGYRHSNEARFDSDVGLVRFSQGRVTSVVFLPD